jgi:hypothetical protein
MKLVVLAVSFCASFSSGASPTFGQAAEIDLITADAVGEDQFFGTALAVWEDRVLVGSPWVGIGPGAAYVLERQESGAWEQEARLTASDGALYDIFGASVALWGDRALVGAHWNPTGDDDPDLPGAAYLFERQPGGQWLEIQRFSDALPDTNFGATVALWDDRAVIGAAGSGLVYVYERQSNGTWAETARLSHVEECFFGGAVSLWANRLLVGSSCSRADGARVFDLVAGQWTEAALLRGNDLAADVRCGSVVSLWDGRALVTGGLGPSRAVYVFERSAAGVWEQRAKLQDEEEGFGLAHALSEDLALVSSPQGSERAGAVHAFRRAANGEWEPFQRLAPDSIGAGDGFGGAVALFGSNGFVGAPHDDIGEVDTGSIHVFDWTPLESDVLDLHTSTGGIQHLALDAGHLQAGNAYIVLGSLSGTSPGISLPGRQILPLNPDGYLRRTLLGARDPLFDSVGILNAAGHAEASFVLPPQAPPYLNGLTFHHAFVVLSPPPSRATPAFISNAVSLSLLP